MRGALTRRLPMFWNHGGNSRTMKAPDRMSRYRRAVFSPTPDRSGQIRGVPNLPVQMRQHRPEASQGLAGHAKAELGDVAFEERSHEALAARSMLVGVRPGQKGPRVAAPDPQRRVTPRQRSPSTSKPRHLAVARRGPPALSETPRTRSRRRAAENAGTWRAGLPVGQHAEEFEQRRLSLDLVDDDEAAQRFEHLFRSFRTQQRVAGILQVEIR